MKMKSTLFLIITIIFCMMLLWYAKDDSCIPDNIVINISKDNNNLTTEEIIRELAKSDKLRPQKVFASVPSFSTDLPFRFLRNYFGVEIPDTLKFHFNKICKLQKFISRKNISQFGGIVLFDYNIGGIKDVKEYKNFVDEIKIAYRQKVDLIVKNKDGYINKYEVQISPYVFADCDLNSDNVRAYCRGPFMKGSYSVSEVILAYEFIGLNSTLSPNVDFQNHYSYNKNKKNSVAIVSEMYKNNLIPVIKHFGYLYKFGNSHNSLVKVEFNENEDDYLFEVYSDVESLRIPYFIMTSSHSLPLDKENPVVFSDYYYSLIKYKYPNSTLMCDEIGMAPLFLYSMKDRIAKLKCDGFIVHSGNFIFKGEDIILGINSVGKSVSDLSVYNVLINKFNYNLISINAGN